MNQSEAELVVALSAECRFSNTTTLDLRCASMGAHGALEKSLAHLRNDVRGSDHHAVHRHKLVNVFRVQFPHALGRRDVKRSNLDLVIENHAGILLEEHLVGCHVEDG